MEIRLAQVQIASIREGVLPQAANPFATGRPTLRLQITAGLAVHELLLTPNDALGPWVTQLRPDATAFEGQLPNLPGSWARLTRLGSTWVGLWFDGVQFYAIDTAAAMAGTNAQAAAASPQSQVVFRLADARLEGAVFDGDTRMAPRTAEDLAETRPSADTPIMLAAVVATHRVNVAMIADAELVALDGSATESRMLARLNVVDGIFSNQVGVRVQSGGTTLLSASEQPFAGTDPAVVLDQLRDYRGSTPAQQSSGLSHLFTGRNLDGQTVGIAYQGNLCSARFSVSLSEARNNVNFDALIAAHEIGHVFGAPHDGEPSSACESTPETFLMARTLNGSSTFSQCSLDHIAPVVTRATCLAPIDAADAAVGAPLTADLALDQTTSVAVTVRSNGNIPVTGVVLNITLPSGVQASAAVFTGGTCTITGAQIRCDVGTLAPGDSREIRLDLLGTVAGNRNATLQLTATNDGLAANDRASMQLRIAPGADLSVSTTATPASALVGTDLTATITVQNLGLAAVTDAQLTATIPSVVTLSALTATGIDCALITGSVICNPSPLNVGATATVSLSLHAATAGTGNLSATLSSTRTDPQSANDQSQQPLTVTNPPPPPVTPPAKSGGGGTTSPLELLLPLLLLLWRRGFRALPSRLLRSQLLRL